jgi:hypothetical protein
VLASLSIKFTGTRYCEIRKKCDRVQFQWRRQSRWSFNPEVRFHLNIFVLLDLSICSALIPFVTGKPIRKLPKELQIGPNASTQEIYSSLAEASGFSIHRLRITKGSDRTVVPNSKGTSVNDIGLRDQSVVHVKDLGMLEF